MSGTAKKDQPPKTDAELIRDQDRRIESLESSDAVRMGKWVLSTQDGTENLIASFEDGGSQVVAKVPDEGTGADDVTQAAEVPVVEQYIPPRCSVARTTNFVAATGTNYGPAWEVTNYSQGAITVGSNFIQIGETGVYDLCFEWQWAQANAGHRAIGLMLNGDGNPANMTLYGFALSTVHPVQVAGTAMAQLITTQRQLNAGDVLWHVIYQDSGGNLGGGAPFWGGICGRFTVTMTQKVTIDPSGQPPDPTPVQGG